jgi:transposase
MKPELTDAEWRRVQRLSDGMREHGGRPPVDHRATVNDILWRLGTGAPWRDMPARYGKWDTVYKWYRRWQQSGGGGV